jgi:hypothetical protein
MTRPTLRDRVARVRTEISRPRDLLLALRIAIWTVVMQGLKYLLPLPTLVRLMSCEGQRVASDTPSENQIVAFARWAYRLTTWRGRGGCLERGLVTYRYLCANGAKPQLVIGVNKSDSGAIKGHAWVVVGDRAIDEGPESLREFRTVGAFGPNGRRLPDL